MWFTIFLAALTVKATELKLSKDITLKIGASSELMIIIEPKLLYTFNGLTLFSPLVEGDIDISFLPYRNCEENRSLECLNLVYDKGLFIILTTQIFGNEFLSKELKWKFLEIEDYEVQGTHRNSYKRAQTTDRDNGSITLDSNMNLEWVITGDSVTFSLLVKKTFSIDSKYGSFGPKSSSSKGDMKNADMIVFYLDQTNKCFDMWSDRNEAPYEDDSNDITCEDRTEDSTYYIYKATRLLDTGDDYDFSFKDLTEVKFIWAWGDVYSGEMEEHSGKGAGSVSVTLTVTESSTTESSTSSTTESSTASTTESSASSPTASSSTTTESSTSSESSSDSTSNQSSFSLLGYSSIWKIFLISSIFLAN